MKREERKREAKAALLCGSRLDFRASGDGLFMLSQPAARSAAREKERERRERRAPSEVSKDSHCRRVAGKEKQIPDKLDGERERREEKGGLDVDSRRAIANENKTRMREEMMACLKFRI